MRYNSIILKELDTSSFGNDDISSEEHMENSKIRRDSCFYLELLIFVHIFEFYLVTQSLEAMNIIFTICIISQAIETFTSKHLQ
jgi:hypothetical protein